jgi:hypothetical protein
VKGAALPLLVHLFHTRLKMFAAFLLDPRLALVVLSALIVAAAIPLAIAWVRILPEEAPPFEIAQDSRHTQKKTSYGFDYVPPPFVPKRSRFSIVLLAALTVCFALQLPGIPRYVGFHSIPAAIPLHPSGWIEILLVSFFLVVPVAAIAHSFFRPNLLSIPLIVASVLGLLLWLLSAPLYAALTGVS